MNNLYWYLVENWLALSLILVQIAVLGWLLIKPDPQNRLKIDVNNPLYSCKILKRVLRPAKSAKIAGQKKLLREDSTI